MTELDIIREAARAARRADHDPALPPETRHVACLLADHFEATAEAMGGWSRSARPVPTLLTLAHGVIGAWGVGDDE